MTSPRIRTIAAVLGAALLPTATACGGSGDSGGSVTLTYRLWDDQQKAGYQKVMAAFEKADVLVSPTAPTTAFKLGEKLDDPLAMYLNDVATIPANLAGVPGMSVPSGLCEDGLPAGFQVIAPAREDARLYRVGAAVEALLEARWGGPILTKAPELEASK